METNLLSTRTAQLKAKYHRLLARLQKAMRMGRFAQFAAHKQQQLLRLLHRYAGQLRRLGYAAALSTPLFVLPNLVDAQPTVQGSEFQVNTYTTNHQRTSAVAMDSDGDFVVVWESHDQDGSGIGIYGQRYNASGTAQGLEFLVTTETLGNQYEPSVAMDDAGNFVVVWQGPDPSYRGIYGQRFNASGTAQGSEFQINTFTAYYQQKPSVAMDSDGDFVVVWESGYYMGSGQDGSLYGIYGQRYNASGTAQGSEFQINTYTTAEQQEPSVAMDDNGNFIVAWHSDHGSHNVYGQRYNASGTSQGSEFLINSYTTTSQSFPSTAMDSDGDFVIVWIDSYQDGSSSGIYGQRYNASGTAQGSEFQINTYTTAEQRDPAIAMDSDGDFTVVWQSYEQDGDEEGIYGQAYNASGVAQGLEFQINTYTTAEQRDPAIAMDSDGDFVVAWASGEYSTSTQDGDRFGTYAQRYGVLGGPFTCGPTAELPTAAGTLVGATATLDADGFTYYCDANEKLLLAIKPPGGGWDIPADAIQLEIGATTVDFFSKFCGATGDDRCFIRHNDGAPIINRYWEVDESKITVGSTAGFVEVKHFFTNAEFLALNAELTAQGLPTLAAVTDMEFYNVNGHTVTTSFPTVPDIKPFEAGVILKNHATTPRPSQWVHSTHGISDHVATFRIFPTMLNAGGGMGGKLKN